MTPIDLVALSIEIEELRLNANYVGISICFARIVCVVAVGDDGHRGSRGEAVSGGDRLIVEAL